MDVGVVTYNANLELLGESYTNIRDVIDHYIIFDNGSHNQDKLCKMFEDDSKVIILRNSTNNGIAVALNRIMKQSQKLGGEWVMLLDHDSMPSRFLIDATVSLTRVAENTVAIICPSIHSVHGKSFANLEQGNDIRIIQGMQVSSIEQCITSGSCLSVMAYEQLGPFDERLFIDEVDYEYCYKAIRHGKIIRRIDNMSLLHEVLPDGNVKQIKILRHTIQIHDLSIPRVYYRIRNIRYLTRKYPGYAKPILFAAKLAIKILFFEKDKKERLSVLIKGYRDGKIM